MGYVSASWYQITKTEDEVDGEQSSADEQDHQHDCPYFLNEESRSTLYAEKSQTPGSLHKLLLHQQSEELPGAKFSDTVM